MSAKRREALHKIDKKIFEKLVDGGIKTDNDVEELKGLRDEFNTEKRTDDNEKNYPHMLIAENILGLIDKAERIPISWPSWQKLVKDTIGMKTEHHANDIAKKIEDLLNRIYLNGYIIGLDNEPLNPMKGLEKSDEDEHPEYSLITPIQVIWDLQQKLDEEVRQKGEYGPKKALEGLTEKLADVEEAQKRYAIMAPGRLGLEPRHAFKLAAEEHKPETAHISKPGSDSNAIRERQDTKYAFVGGKRHTKHKKNNKTHKKKNNKRKTHKKKNNKRKTHKKKNNRRRA